MAHKTIISGAVALQMARRQLKREREELEEKKRKKHRHSWIKQTREEQRITGYRYFCGICGKYKGKINRSKIRKWLK